MPSVFISAKKRKKTISFPYCFFFRKVIGDGNVLETQWKSLFGTKINPIITMTRAKLKIVHICKTKDDHLTGFGTIMSVFQLKILMD